MCLGERSCSKRETSRKVVGQSGRLFKYKYLNNRAPIHRKVKFVTCNEKIALHNIRVIRPTLHNETRTHISIISTTLTSKMRYFINSHIMRQGLSALIVQSVCY
jgi:hypothetical protein